MNLNVTRSHREPVVSHNSRPLKLFNNFNFSGKTAEQVRDKLPVVSLQWSPDVAELPAVDDEASLLAESSPVSPPFVRAPLEDRSKYEKLAFNADDLSSDSEKEIAQRNEERMKKKRRRVKGVLSRRKNREQTIATHDPPTAAGEYESEDSIGSASDLKAMNDEECNLEHCDDDDDNDRDKIDETISESVRTCGSSAYHAECESVATHEDDHRMRKPRKHQQHQQNLPTIEADPVVGHEYGEKPLLLDDELDTEGKPEELHGDPFVAHQYNSSTKPLSIFDRDSSTSDENPSKHGLFKTEQDVFAMAPFHRPTGSRKSSASRESAPKTTTSPSSPIPTTSLATPVSNSPIISGNLVDIGDNDDDCVEDVQFYPVTRPTRNNYENINFIVAGAISSPILDERDLFGSSPFSSTGFVNPFNQLVNFSTPSNDTIVQLTTGTITTTTTTTTTMTTPTTTTLEQESRLYGGSYVNVGPVKVKSSSKFGNVNVVNSGGKIDESPKDLFGSIPFDEFASLSAVGGIQQRPTSLPLSQSPTFVDSALNTILSTSGQSSHSAQLPTSAQIIYSVQPVLTSNNQTEDLSSPMMTPMSPDEPLVVIDDSLKHKKEKSKSDKSKYHLMNENRSDNINVLPSKIIQKSKGVIVGYKKSTKGKKNSGAGVAATAGFSNMSFEDFPSDENDERTAASKVAPFEVIRETEKRSFGSLKRRSNPFT